MRVYNKEPHQLEEGEYGRWEDDHNNWYGRPSGTDLVANLTGHTVVEHDDGTITVSPSILIYGGKGEGPEATWHGYLEHGVWRKC